MVFLILEGVLRRPVSEKVVVAFHYVGFLFIISLMLFVLGLDFGLDPAAALSLSENRWGWLIGVRGAKCQSASPSRFSDRL